MAFFVEGGTNGPAVRAVDPSRLDLRIGKILSAKKVTFYDKTIRIILIIS